MTADILKGILSFPWTCSPTRECCSCLSISPQPPIFPLQLSAATPWGWRMAPSQILTSLPPVPGPTPLKPSMEGRVCECARWLWAYSQQRVEQGGGSLYRMSRCCTCNHADKCVHAYTPTQPHPSKVTTICSPLMPHRCLRPLWSQTTLSWDDKVAVTETKAVLMNERKPVFIDFKRICWDAIVNVQTLQMQLFKFGRIFFY